jgi:hypothetical protein
MYKNTFKFSMLVLLPSVALAAEPNLSTPTEPSTQPAMQTDEVISEQPINGDKIPNVISTIEEVINKTPKSNGDIPSVIPIKEEVSETPNNDDIPIVVPIEEVVSETPTSSDAPIVMPIGESDTPTNEDIPGVISIEEVISEPSTNGETVISIEEVISEPSTNGETVIPFDEAISESSTNSEPIATPSVANESPAEGDIRSDDLLDNKEQKQVKSETIPEKDPLNQVQQGPRCKVTIIGDRYTDNNDGTVTDNRTCMIWLKDANCIDKQTWADTFVQICQLNGRKDCKSKNRAENEDEKPLDCKEYTIGTITGWRLPTIQELQSLMHYDFYNPVISNAEGNERWGEKPENDAFSSVQLDLYWSSTTNALGATQAWHIRLTDGNTGTSDKERAKNYVWPVYKRQ